MCIPLSNELFNAMWETTCKHPIFELKHKKYWNFTKNRTGIPFLIFHWDIELYLINQRQCILFWIPNNLYLDFNFQIDKIASFRETSDDLYLASQF